MNKTPKDKRSAVDTIRGLLKTAPSDVDMKAIKEDRLKEKRYDIE